MMVRVAREIHATGIGIDKLYLLNPLSYGLARRRGFKTAVYSVGSQVWLIAATHQSTAIYHHKPPGHDKSPHFPDSINLYAPVAIPEVRPHNFTMSSGCYGCLM